MKRFFLLIVLLLVVSWLIGSHRAPLRRPHAPANYWVDSDRPGHNVEAARQQRTAAAETRRKARRALAEAGAEVRQALDEAKVEVRNALDEARGEVRQAIHELRESLASDEEQPGALPPVAPAPPAAIEEAEGLPVRIVPGTRVTEAKASAPAARASVSRAVTVVAGQPAQSTITGRLSATRDRAVADARRALRDELTDWLEPEVPRSWAVPESFLNAMIVGEPQIKKIDKSYGEIFEATLTVDRSPQRRGELVAVYSRQVVERRMFSLSGLLAFVLICLAAISGYIRADEATKGYYTNRLRVLAAAGVGASGVILYHMIV
jgi:hypothetical protein